MLDKFRSLLTPGERHPLATPRGLQNAIDALPTAVRKEALRKAAEWFASLDSPGLTAAQKLDVLLSFDDAVHQYQELLWLHMRGSQSKDLAFVGVRQALIEYSAAFSQQVDNLIGLAVSDGTTEITAGERILVLAGRSLRTLAGWKRIRHLDHEIILPEIWSRLLVVLKFGFQCAAETQSICLYQEEPATTLQHEFLRGVMLDTLPLANMTWRQIETMSAVLDHFSDKFLLRAEPSQLTPYFFNLAQSNGPQHASRMPAPTAAVFIGPGAAFPEIVQMSKQVATNRRLPDWLVPPEGSKPGETAKALMLTVRHWSRTPPQRNSDRQRSGDLLQVVHGFQQTRAALSRADSVSKSSSPTLGYYANNPIYTTQRLAKPRRGRPEGADTWEVVDESPTGIGAVPKTKSSLLAVGALLGCFRTQEEEWQLAIVRRTSHDRKKRFLVGMQFIPGTPYAANIGFRANETGSPLNTGGVSWDEVIVLPDQNKLLSERRGFFPEMAALLQIVDKEQRYIKLVKIEETHTDCECWIFQPATVQEWEATRNMPNTKRA